MGSGPRWSLIVPSHDGADTLPACLGALGQLRAPVEGMEIVLVDNGSSDASAALMQEFAGRAGVLFLSEPRRGKSFALNTAIERAQGEMLVFLDDDVIAAPGLLDAYAEAESAFPEAGVYGGQVRPHWSASPPGWLVALADEGRACGCTPKALDAGWLDPIQVKGGNMAIRRAALGSDRFATEGVNFGATGRAVGGEDAELVHRLAARSPVRFVPEASVAHLVAHDEMAWKNVFARGQRIGRSMAAQGLAGPAIVPLALRAAIRAGLAGLALLTGRRNAAAGQGLSLALRLGALDYLRRR